jgi:hypothetical protein
MIEQLADSSWRIRMNAISVIAPYKHEGLWVFDDPDVGLRREPFVSGIDQLIDRLAAHPNASHGFRLLFSPTPFPGYMARLEWRRSELGGNCIGVPSSRWRDGSARRFSSISRKLHGNCTPERRRRLHDPDR